MLLSIVNNFPSAKSDIQRHSHFVSYFFKFFFKFCILLFFFFLKTLMTRSLETQFFNFFFTVWLIWRICRRQDKLTRFLLEPKVVSASSTLGCGPEKKFILSNPRAKFHPKFTIRVFFFNLQKNKKFQNFLFCTDCIWNILVYVKRYINK